MAWTWSTPQRGRLAGAAVVSNSHRSLTSALHRAAVTLGRGDASRGVCVGYAAFLTLTGAAAPHLSSPVMAALLFLSAAPLVLFASLSSTSTARDTRRDHTNGPIKIANERRALPAAHIEELIAQRPAPSITDRAAFARLTAHMSHELRTPLNAILGFSEMMSNEVFGPLGSSSYAAYARDIHTSGISLLKSADDALAITALLTANEYQERAAHTHISSTAADALAFHAPAFAANGISTHCTVDADAEILANPQAVRQLLINLIDDATMTAAPGAHMTIASRCDRGEFEICLTCSGTREEIAAAPAESFSMLLARTLAELCGATLTATTPSDRERYVTVRFLRATQNDLFA